MNPELQRLLDQAKAALAAGADPAAVDRRFAELSGGRFKSLAEVTAAIPAPAPAVDPKEAAYARLNARGGSAVGDFLRMAAQGATFGFADELTGLWAARSGKDYKTVRDASRQRVADLRLLAPGASIVAEVAGGAAVPIAGGSAVATRLAPAGSGLIARAGAGGIAGALTGAVGGGLYGAGESTAEDLPGLLRDAGSGAKVGGAVGGILGAGAPVVAAGAGKAFRFGREVVAPAPAARSEAVRSIRRALEDAGLTPGEIEHELQGLGPNAVVADIDPSLARAARNARNQSSALDRAGGPVSELAARAETRGERLAQSLRESSGLTQNMETGRALAEQAVEDVRNRFYRPLQRLFPSVAGENVAAALRDPRISRVAQRVSPDLVRRRSPRSPSFTELQDMMMDLRDDMTAARAAGRPNASMRAGEAFDMLVTAMQTDIPGFSDAQNAFRSASRTLDAFNEGYRLSNKPARAIREALDELPAESRDAFRVGMLERWQEDLLSREGGGAAAGKLINAGEEQVERLRILFGSEDGLQRFLRQRGLEETFGITWNAVSGNSTSAMQLSDALQSAPVSRSDLMNRVWNAVFSPGDSRRIQSRLIGEYLMGRDPYALPPLLRPRRASVGGLLGGLPGAAGALTPVIFGNRQD